MDNYHRHLPNVKFLAVVRIECRGCFKDTLCDFPAHHVCEHCGGRCFQWTGESIKAVEKLGKQVECISAPPVVVLPTVIAFEERRPAHLLPVHQMAV